MHWYKFVVRGMSKACPHCYYRNTCKMYDMIGGNHIEKSKEYFAYFQQSYLLFL